MKIKRSKIKVGEVNSQDLTIPLIAVGSGKPVFGIVTGLHGREPEGLFVVRELLKKLGPFKGTLKIIPGANPLALAFATQWTPFDAKDLNRSFPGKKDGTITERIAFAIFKELKDCFVVFDIHSVTNIGCFMGMQFGIGTKVIQKRADRFLRLLKPDIIWRPNTNEEFPTALSPSLINRGVCSVGVELPRLEFLPLERVEEVVSGFLRILRNPKRIRKLTKPLPILSNTKRCFADKGGIYIPEKELMSKVKKGEVVGRIADLNTFEEQILRSGFDGFLFVQSSRKLASTGDKIFVVAEKVGDFR